MKDLPLDSTDLTWLAGLAQALLREPHAADDLVQEAAVAALEGSIPAEAPRRAWLATVARRLAARRFRGESRRERREELAARPEALPDSTELVERAEVAEQVTAAARRLPEPYRRTILLRFLEGRSPEEIAREEGKPADTVRWRVRRGLELLREELVREHDRDWSSWSVLLLPLARSHGEAGLATAGAAGGVTGLVASWMTMKGTMVVAAALGCLGIWMVGDEEREAEALRGRGAPAQREVARGPSSTALAPLVALEAPDAGDATGSDRTAQDVGEGPGTSDDGAERDAVPASDLVGTVVDEEGEPVPGAEVFLVPAAGSALVREGNRVRTSSDWRGAFRIARSELRAASSAPEDELAFDLGVSADGFRRRFVPDVLGRESGGNLVVVLERGRTLRGRVVDTDGRPVSGLQLLVCSGDAAIEHVSPSQRRLRAQRRELGDASVVYDQCIATTDGRGEVLFVGLPPGNLQVRPLDPGWTIEATRRVDEDTSYVEWTVQRRLGVRLLVVDARTGAPVERSSATFCFEATFANGDVVPFEQWVGRGDGEVSFVLDGESLPGLEKRTLTRVVFYGTVRSGEGAKVDWVADAIEDVNGAVGVAEVRVEVDPTPPLPEEVFEELEGTTLVEVDVRYEDGVPFQGDLYVRWLSRADPSRNDGDEAELVGPGRYRLEIPAGTWTLQVADDDASGSLPPWSETVRCEPDGRAAVFATLQRGARATIPRPEGWTGEWFVQSSWRSDEGGDWQGGIVYSTASSSMTLTVLRPAEWRFELRRSSLAPDPVVRTVVLAEGDAAVVGD